jgi:rhodanese-related sulfurtransferase
MMPKCFSYFLILFTLAVSPVFAQDPFAEVLKAYNEGSIPYIEVSELDETFDSYIILDAREIEEYRVSHLKNAIHVGYKNFKPEKLSLKLNDKTQKIVVYCSIGVRSEDIAERLKAMGYQQVYNLYGGIFNWVNEDKPVYKHQQQATDSIHAYSKNWAPYITRGIKVYE